MSRMGLASRALGCAIALSGLVGGAVGARAQDASQMSCEQLWQERNAIYARNGYCFKTARARAVFGPGCFPPYGELRGWEKQRVNELQTWERRFGC